MTCLQSLLMAFLMTPLMTLPADPSNGLSKDYSNDFSRNHCALHYLLIPDPSNGLSNAHSNDFSRTILVAFSNGPLVEWALLIPGWSLDGSLGGSVYKS